MLGTGFVCNPPPAGRSCDTFPFDSVLDCCVIEAVGPSSQLFAKILACGALRLWSSCWCFEDDTDNMEAGLSMSEYARVA